MSVKSPPPEVLAALETLESATAPGELGAPYQILLDWRRRHPFTAYARYFTTPIIALVILVSVVVSLSMFRYVTPQNPEFWRGVHWGVMGTVFISLFARWIWPLPAPPPSIGQRIEDAVDRWRHAAPRMREIPQ